MKQTNFSLKTKLLFLCLFLSGVSMAVGLMSFKSMRTVSFTYEKITTDSLPNIRSADRMYLAYKNVRLALRTLGLPGISEADTAAAIKDVAEAINQYEIEDTNYKNAPFTDGEKELYDKVESAWADFKKVGATVLELQKMGTPEAKAQMMHIFLNDCPEKAKIYNAALNDLVNYDLKNADLWVQESRDSASRADTIMIILISAGLLLGMGCGYLFATSVSKSVNKVSADLAEGAHQVAQAATQIAHSSQGLSQSATQQASSLEETVATMEELTAMVRVNSENAKEAARLGASTRDIAVKGEMEIKTLIESINGIATDSKKIEEITSVVDDIAFQTNLLALNAAVEAARAGEQGKGFAVVAEAVRNLAQRSSAAAKDIANLIKVSVEKIEVGTVQATHGGKVLGEIVTAVKKVSDLNHEISTASEEQSHGILQIGKALNQLDQVTQQNAAASEEAAAAAEELSAQSVSLKSSVNSLDKIVKGGVANEATPATPSHSEAQPTAKVVPLKRSPSLSASKSPTTAASTIPFDEDERDERTKLGHASDF